MSQPRTPMLEQIYSLPEMAEQRLSSFLGVAKAVVTAELGASLAEVYVVGCGDSHMAGVGAELAFHTLAGVPTRATTALHFARYIVPSLGATRPYPLFGVGKQPERRTLVIGVSVSGEVARTVEAVRLARKAGAITAAVTGALQSRLAGAAEHVLQTTIPPLRSARPTPGVRSYMASLLMLYSTAVRIGEARGFLSATDAAAARDELRQAPEAIAATLRANDEAVERLIASWHGVRRAEFVFLGGGPNYGTALFSAAKLLEASGDAALGQDVEEWAHLQYFARERRTPTFVIDARGRSYSRACEVAVAARAIGRRVAAVVPQGEETIAAQADAVLPIHGGVREAFSPLLYSLPGMLLANYRAQALQESYYRAFGGGRSVREGGGASRVLSSEIQEDESLWNA
jgi:glucosamine--fructose-6-phosphate aminotransferase (isomerizing)